MGCTSSKSARNYEGGHTVLGSTDRTAGQSARAVGTSNGPAPSNPRAAAAEAAERRMQAAQKRGTVGSNPKGGQLAAKLAKENSSRPQPTEQEAERLVWD